MLPKKLISWVLVFLVGCALRRDVRSSTTGAAPLQGDDEAIERIVGGKPVDPPYKYASLLCLRWVPTDFLNRCTCGATILDDRWALTAAHCAAKIYKSPPGEYYFIAGEHNTVLEEGPEQRVGIKYPIIHEDYNDSDDNNDIAIVRVNTPFRFSNMVNPVNLPPSSFVVSENQSVIGHAVGWGQTQLHGPRPLVVQEVAVPLITTERCQLLLENYNITDHQLCAGYDEGGKDACLYDSGGPLYTQDAEDGSIIQVGIVSWGEGCAEPETPGVYVNVAKYLDWIEKHRKLVAVYDEVAAAGLKH